MSWTETQKKYAHSEKGLAARKRYFMSEKGKATLARNILKRKIKLQEMKKQKNLSVKPALTKLINNKDDNKLLNS